MEDDAYINGACILSVLSSLSIYHVSHLGIFILNHGSDIHLQRFSFCGQWKEWWSFYSLSNYNNMLPFLSEINCSIYLEKNDDGEGREEVRVMGEMGEEMWGKSVKILIIS